MFRINAGASNGQNYRILMLDGELARSLEIACPITIKIRLIL